MDNSLFTCYTVLCLRLQDQSGISITLVCHLTTDHSGSLTLKGQQNNSPAHKEPLPRLNSNFLNVHNIFLIYLSIVVICV